MKMYTYWSSSEKKQVSISEMNLISRKETATGQDLQDLQMAVKLYTVEDSIVHWCNHYNSLDLAATAVAQDFPEVGFAGIYADVKAQLEYMRTM